MRNAVNKGMALLVMVGMMILSTQCVMAGMNEKVELAANQQWTHNYPSARTGEYSHVWAHCDSVYPSSGIDNFKKIQVRILNSSGTLIMNNTYETLTEGAESTSIDIKEGYLGTTTVNYQFRGNSSSAVTAIVDYWCN